MKISNEELGRALDMAFADHWENGLPEVPAKLRLVINSLLAQTGNKLPKDPERLRLLIGERKNRRIRQILRHQKITTEGLAFAIRDALS